MHIDLRKGDCEKVLQDLEDNSIDLVVTSPPYDDLRNYNNTLNWNLDVFKKIAHQLYRVLKEGGVIIWVVGDKTKDGSESGTSMRQALHFMDLGLNLHDTMIYKKQNFQPLNHNRYEQEWEYMFCFSKGRPKTFNPIKVKCKYGGTASWGKTSYYKTDDGTLTEKEPMVIGEYKIKGNIFEYLTGSIKTGKIQHPAMFPLELAIDQIKSWSNENDVVLDPFMGSGTTGIASKQLHRNFIGIEVDEEYYNLSKERIDAVTVRQSLF